MVPRLLESEINARLASVPDWKLDEGEIVRIFTFADFVEAVGFVNRVADLAEAANHHPDVDIRWNAVTLRLSTHSRGGLTAADFTLATRIDHSEAARGGVES